MVAADFGRLERFGHANVGVADDGQVITPRRERRQCAFLDELETQRGNTSRSRNLRLTAIRSFFRYASFEAPAHSAHIQRVLAIPTKRSDKRQLQFLTREEIS